MADLGRDLARQWMAKADGDLASARILLFGEERHLDTGAYHCQQAAEKALKAFLASKDAPLQRIHDLERLISCCADHEPAFSLLMEKAAEITPYATEFRYPGETLELSDEDARMAWAISAEIVKFVKTRLSLG
jgi:HEPN domain-containing protein